MKRKITSLLCAIFIFNLFYIPVFAQTSQDISINGQKIDLGPWVLNEEGTSYIPFAVVSNLLNADSSFDEKQKAMTMEKDGIKLWLQANNKTAIINGVKTSIPRAPKMQYNTLFLPLKLTFETLGASIGWDQESRVITIEGKHLNYTGQSMKELLEEPLPNGFTQIKINAVGDCILGFDSKFSITNRFDTVVKEKGGDYSYFFKNVKAFFEIDDLTIANLENPLTNASKKAVKEFAFKGKPEYTQILKEGSVEVVNLANNHTYDYFDQGINDTYKNLDKFGIGYFGNGKKSIKNVKGIKVGNLGYKGWNNSKGVKDGIKYDIAMMKQETDIVIVTFHWGVERANYPNSIQKDLGRFAIDQGADLVLGHHPHVIQGIEEYKGKPIVYSLGNFSFGGNRNPADKDTFIFQHNFTLNQNKKIVSTRSNVIPCTVSSVTYRNDYCPTPQTGTAGQRIINRLKQYSSVFPKTL